MIVDNSILVIQNLAFFASGFGLAVVAFWSEIRIGVQVIREARAKAKAGVTAINEV